jgi:2-isopropylmalate synthase
MSEQGLRNPQRGSSMPFRRYVRAASGPRPELLDRKWPARTIDRAPLWASVDLRDGNQALANPMDARRKSTMFNLLVELGFKEIEVGYPAASNAEFAFVRDLVTQDRIPDDVTITVFTPARIDLIDRTFEAIQGVDRAIVHLCLATACLWRDVVFGMSLQELRQLTIRAAEHVSALADRMGGSQLRFEYSPETFNVTEPEFALEICNAVTSTWDASPDRPVTLNLPSTVETDTPNVFADQVEWMDGHVDNRESIILSVHPHNDRGTAVATAELALMAGADRVEGTLFGNGERTGNVCLATLALNLFSHGIDPQLDFSNIDDVRACVEFCNQMPVSARHPYVGDLVYTAFSGTHQDAIAKGLAAHEEQAREAGEDPAERAWSVPYLPIDPKDVGRTYESVVRVNSQSGKGGVAHILKSRYRLDLPRALRIEFARAVQKITDETGVEMNSWQLWEIFSNEYLRCETALSLKEFEEKHEDGRVRVVASLALAEGREERLTGTGTTPAAALADGLSRRGHPVELRDMESHMVDDPNGSRVVSYTEVSMRGVIAYGVGLDTSPPAAELHSVLSAVNRAMRSSSLSVVGNQ